MSRIPLPVKRARLRFWSAKGATPEMIERTDTALTRYAHLIARDLHVDVLDLAGGGAAGGMGRRYTRFAARSYGVALRLSPMRFIWKRVLRMLI